MDTRILALSAANGGYVRRSAILDSGYSDRDIRSAVRSKTLIRLRVGTYAPADTFNALPPEGKHRVLAFAVADKLGKNAVITHHSSCAAHGFPLFGFSLHTVSVTRLDDVHGNTTAGVQHHVGKLADNEIEMVDGHLVSVPTRALWEAAAAGSIESGLVVINGALHRGACTIDDLREAREQFEYWRGSRSARMAMRLADPRIETVGESRSFFMFWRHHLPRPTPQVRIYGANGNVIARVDFLWEEYHHVGEFDGMGKYDDLLGADESPKGAIVSERQREQAVRDERLGVSRWMTPDLNRPRDARTVNRIRREMEQSRTLFTRNRVTIA